MKAQCRCGHTPLGRLFRMWFGLVQIAEGLVHILTMGSVLPLWTLRTTAWALRHSERLYHWEDVTL